MLMRLLFTLLILVLVTGCSAVDMKRYSANEPQLDLFEYFSGNTTGWGIVQDRKGALIRRFVVEVVGEVTENGQLVLREKFEWSDGELSDRTWILSQQDNHRFTGTADDVLDQADGVLYGNVLNWQYQLMLQVEDSSWKIKFDDWMFLVSEDMLINKATMSKFGFKVGEVTIVFRK
jgi:hypothetical protein